MACWRVSAALPPATVRPHPVEIIKNVRHQYNVHDKGTSFLALCFILVLICFFVFVCLFLFIYLFIDFINFARRPGSLTEQASPRVSKKKKKKEKKKRL